MATIDYKEKYEQALERARQFSEKPYLEDSAGIVEYIFPELKESEDAIRKELISFLKSPFVNENITDEKVAPWIDWLEKQGMPAKYHDICDTCVRQPTCQSDCFLQQSEQKPTDKVKPKFKVGDVIRLKGSNAEYMITIVTDTTYYTNGWSCSIERCEEDYELVEQKPIDKVEPKFKVGDKIKLAKEPKYPAREIIAIKNDAYYFDELVRLPLRYQDNWELVEQKPEVDKYSLPVSDNSSLPTFDESIHHHCSEEEDDDDAWLNDIVSKAECNLQLNKGEIDFLKSLKNRVQPQPKQEWSEEDELMLKYTIEHFEREKRNSIEGGVRKNSMQEFIDWLKSIKDRVRLQSRQEWSEGDKRIIDNLISQLGNLYARKLIKEETKDKYVNWLKSLRPKSQWKPSDEQMLAIDTAINVLGKGTLNGKQLIELQEQLKKLKGEEV